MAKDKAAQATAPEANEPTVLVPASLLQRLEAKIEALEHTQRVQQEALAGKQVLILDQEYERWKREAGRSAAERTQDLADRSYDGPCRYRVRMDSTLEDGKPGPRIDEFFPLVLRAHSDLEAQARYQEIMGIRKTDHKIVVEEMPEEELAAVA